MKTRDDLPLFLNRLGLIGVGVEVGVHQGAFSEAILRDWKGQRLYSVDPWSFQPGAKLDKSNVGQPEHDRCRQMTIDRLRKFGKRSVILHTFSPQVTKTHHFSDIELDFVYLDARHDYRSVTADLKAWFPLIKHGGIIAGHDYKDSCVRGNLVEVKRAVNAFFHADEIQTTTDDNLPSWWVRRDKSACQTNNFCYNCEMPEWNCLCSHDDYYTSNH